MFFPVTRRYKDYILKPFQRDKFTAVNNVDLKIESGDRVAFLGINGAGKTTLLKLTGGLLYPSKGNILVNGFNTVSQNLEARTHVGFVLNEERSFYWRLNAVQNLEFFGALDNLHGRALDRRIEELLVLVGLEKAAHKRVASYSSGMKQRLAIARGLLGEPGILILDEPTRTLDPEAVDDVKSLISARIHRHSLRTLLIATHRFDEAEELCNKVCIMKNGRMISFKSLADIKAGFGSVSNYYHHYISGENVITEY